MPSSSSTDWRDQAREFLPGMKRPPQRKDLLHWPRCIKWFANLPWLAIVLAALAIAVVIVFIVFIAARPNNVQSSAQSSGTSVITVQCSTATSQLFCEQQIAEAAINQDFQQAITETHLFTTLAMFVVATLVYFVIKAIRLRKQTWYLENRPRDSMAIWTDDDYWERARRVPLHAEMVRSFRLLKHLQTSNPSSQGKLGDENYAHPKSGIAGTQLPRTIARSYVHLESAAVAYDPLLHSRPEQTVREYVAFLKLKCPGINAAVADVYVEKYEQARFSDDVIGEAAWYQCTNALFQLVEYFETKRAEGGPPSLNRARSPRTPEQLIMDVASSNSVTKAAAFSSGGSQAASGENATLAGKPRSFSSSLRLSADDTLFFFDGELDTPRPRNLSV